MMLLAAVRTKTEVAEIVTIIIPILQTMWSLSLDSESQASILGESSSPLILYPETGLTS